MDARKAVWRDRARREIDKAKCLPHSHHEHGPQSGSYDEDLLGTLRQALQSRKAGGLVSQRDVLEKHYVERVDKIV